jgi:hypothetical protein
MQPKAGAHTHHDTTNQKLRIGKQMQRNRYTHAQTHTHTHTYTHKHTHAHTQTHTHTNELAHTHAQARGNRRRVSRANTHHGVRERLRVRLRRLRDVVPPEHDLHRALRTHYRDLRGRPAAQHGTRGLIQKNSKTGIKYTCDTCQTKHAPGAVGRVLSSKLCRNTYIHASNERKHCEPNNCGPRRCKSNQTKQNKIKQNRPNQIKSNQIKSNQIKSSQSKATRRALTRSCSRP